MAVEIRELVIKTQINTPSTEAPVSQKDLDNLRKQLLKEIKKATKGKLARGQLQR